MMYAVLTATPVISTDIVGELVTLVGTCIGLFSSFPLNVFLIAGIIGIGFSIFRKAKSSV